MSKEINLFDSDFQEMVVDFIVGLKKKAGVSHAGNCLVMSQVLQGYFRFLGIETELMNAKVIQNRYDVNHYFLKLDNKTIVDPTASQFEGMPVVYFGMMPDNYKKVKSVTP